MTAPAFRPHRRTDPTGCAARYSRRMAELTVFHNPRCSTSRHALDAVERAGAQVEVVQYLKQPLDRT